MEKHPENTASSNGVLGGPSGPAWTLVFAAWLVAAASTLGALFLGEVMGVATCSLCWYQRIFMFPLAFVLAAALFPLDARVYRYAFPLSAAGLLIAVYHLLLVHGVIPEAMAPCRQGIPCSRVEIEWLGFVTIPLLSVVAFSVINVLLLAAYLKVRK